MRSRPLGLSPQALQNVLIVAGVCCCVAMSMPQVHLVAYCGDLGYGAARGAQMLSLLLGCGIVSRLIFGWISDHIGGLRTLLIGSGMQCFALLLFLPFDGLASLFVISALFGLFQGGIVPSYAMIIREYFSPREAGARIGIVLTATMVGMALGGWMSGRDLRPDWFVPGGVHEWHRLQSGEHGDCHDAARQKQGNAVTADCLRGFRACCRSRIVRSALRGE